MDFISPYINSDKKLHIRFEKLFALLLTCGFSGKIVVFSGAESLSGPEVISVSIPASGYYSGSAAGGFGLWVSWSDLASAIGLTADKLKPGVTVLGITGN